MAINLALSLSPTHEAQLLDCDVEEPNGHIFLHSPMSQSESVFIPVPKVDETKCQEGELNKKVR